MINHKETRPFLTYPAVIDWLQWAEFPDRMDKPDMPQITLLLIKEYRDAIKELELDQARVTANIKALLQVIQGLMEALACIAIETPRAAHTSDVEIAQVECAQRALAQAVLKMKEMEKA